MLRRTCLLWVALVLAAGCGATGVPCELDSDCAWDELCSDDRECTRGTRSCEVHDDCDPGRECGNGACRESAPCEVDGDCPTKRLCGAPRICLHRQQQICDARNTCIERSCSDTSDCAEGFRCGAESYCIQP